MAGPAGVGKTRLVSDWVARSDEATVTVVATRASATVPFGAFAPWVPDGFDPGRDRLGTLRSITGRLLEQEPVTVAVDDAHLLDDGSAALVLHLARHTSARLVLTVRSGEPCPDPVTALWKDGTGTRIDLRALSEHECSTLLRHRLGHRAHSTAEQRLWALSAGNPMHLREATEAALEQGQLAEADGVWSLAGPLPGTPRLVDLVEARIGRISDDDRRALELVALGEPVPLTVLTAVLATDQPARLEADGLLAVTSQRGTEVVALCHPLYGEVLRATIPRLTARGHHRALAAAAVAQGYAERDPLRVAVWLQEGGGSAADTDLLVAASGRALVLQEYGLADRLATAGVEAGGGTAAHLARARVLGLVGWWQELDGAIEAAARAATEPADVREVAQVRATRDFWRQQGWPSAHRVIEEALARLPPEEGAEAAATGATLALHSLALDDTRALAARAVTGDVGPRLLGRALDGWAATLQGQPSVLVAEFAALAPAVLERLPVDPLPAAFTGTAYQVAMVLTGGVDEAAVLMEAVAGRDMDDEQVYLALPSLVLAQLALVQGRVRTAAGRALRALELMGEDRPYVYARPVAAAATGAVAWAQAGEVEAAVDALRRGEQRPDAWVPDVRAALDLGRAWVAGASGGLTEGTAIALDTADRMAASGAPTLEMLALVEATRLGGADQAASRLVALGEVVEGPHARAAADLACGLVDGDGPRLDEAATAFASAGARLLAAEAASQAARFHADRGLRRREAEARRRARGLLATCEGAATPLLSGLDHRDVVDDLTAREHEVALMAAAGRTNRDIATALGVSLRTVNSHLNHAYAKLGTSERHELAHLLGPPDRDLREAPR